MVLLVVKWYNILLYSDRCTAAEWTLRHWHRTSAVQCCHLQPLINKMIPIYFDDPKLPDDMHCVSQIFISDKAGKNVRKRNLNIIRRTHSSIDCLSTLPSSLSFSASMGNPNSTFHICRGNLTTLKPIVASGFMLLD
ncbi:hypothetical protein K503DRAFT_330006 [Rhizopogon vinicolor AM-OR11-026]|uniref:Uncharacterized protein n=1 Tax=Rhizopogon vinicolor AM-OR11-026 TaxID=1314800 RepID=A0A1B7MTY9_9AGAM|nr:hypothetical protein K503DRAFT_330006 [Rhizopogon vinicolor AM-OR11-026]